MKPLSISARFWLLPVRARLFVLALLVLTALPGAAAVTSELGVGAGGLWAFLGSSPLLATALSAALACAVLVVFEWPRPWSLRSYPAQVRRAFQAVVQHYHAALERLQKEHQQ